MLILHFHWRHNDVISGKNAGKMFNYPLPWFIRMVHVKNYENIRTIFWDMQKKQVASSFPDTVYVKKIDGVHFMMLQLYKSLLD